MFWGLSMESEKRYTQTVSESFHISQASIDIASISQETSPTQVILEYENNDFLLATLSKNAKIYQVPLDLNFQKGDHIAFRTVGPGIVHLTGYHVFDDDDLESRLMAGDDSEEDDDEEEKMLHNSVSDDSVSAPPGKRKKPVTNAGKNKKSKLDDSDDEDEDDEGHDTLGSLGDSTLLELEAEEGEDDSDEEDDDDDEGEEEEEEEDDDEGDGDSDEEDEEEDEEEKPVNKKKDKNVSLNGVATPGKKDKLNQSKKETAKTPKSETKNAKQEGKNLNQSKQEKTPKQENKTPKQEKKTPKENNVASPASPGQKKVLEGGVVAEELKIGNGPPAKPGKMAQVYYVGRLKSNNKQFDASTSGPGFKFRVGRGEVIKGWDIGVAGMRVGGKRRLTIPAGMGYGGKGSPPVIPPNATLVFEVELRGLS